jgi:predicted RNA binding protein YcfA (HicA-like mRNA interferase family)
MPTSRDLLRFLRNHGYREVRQSGSHLILEHAERPMLVIPVHRGKDLPRGLFIRILKDAGFTLEEFRKS